jgi:hypothetical protein
MPVETVDIGYYWVGLSGRPYEAVPLETSGRIERTALVDTAEQMVAGYY